MLPKPFANRPIPTVPLRGSVSNLKSEMPRTTTCLSLSDEVAEREKTPPVAVTPLRPNTAFGFRLLVPTTRDNFAGVVIPG
jgi:hypothetical protein